MLNEFDTLMQTLAGHNIVAFVRNCDMGDMGGIPATFNYKYTACLLWTAAPHMSRRAKAEADGKTPTEALNNAIAAAGLVERLTHKPKGPTDAPVQNL